MEKYDVIFYHIMNCNINNLLGVIKAIIVYAISMVSLEFWGSAVTEANTNFNYSPFSFAHSSLYSLGVLIRILNIAFLEASK